MGNGAQRFVVSDNNPNDGIGGRGCLCSPLHCEDAAGPYAIFPATETDSNASPHAVLCLPCAQGVVRAAGGERLAAGEDPVARERTEDEPGI